MAFTVFCLGSGQSYKKSKNINTSLFDACEVGSRLRLDGPAKLGGAYDPERIEFNVATAKTNIKSWLYNNEPDTDGKYKINLSGFSRGSTTCLKIANALQVMLENGELVGKDGKKLSLDDIEVNIFAEDPVAGASDKGDLTNKVIPPIVRNYTATLQMDEFRRGFNPQDKSRVIPQSQNTTVTFLPMPGNHSEANNIKSDKTKDGALIHYKLKYDFLKANGTRFNPTEPPKIAISGSTKSKDKIAKNLDSNFFRSENSNARLLDHYAIAKQNRTHYKKKGLGVQYKDTPTLGKERGFNKNLDDYVTDSFFTNQHERELFKQTYPKTFNYLFEKNRTDRLEQNKPDNEKHTGRVYSNIKTIKPELERMQKDNPKLLENLNKAGKIKKNQSNEFTIPNIPQGVSRIERCEFTNSMNRKTTQYENQEERQLHQLEKELFKITSQYKRGKNELMGFSERTQFARAEQMRKEVRAIASSGQPNDLKYKQALNKIQDNLLDLKASDNKSKLTAPLEKLLKEHGREYATEKNPQNATYLAGKTVKNVGKSIRLVGIGVATVMGTIGEPLVRAGERTALWSNSGWRQKTGIMPVVGGLIGGGLYSAGWLIREGGRMVEKTGSLIHRMGNALVKRSKVHSITIKETPVENHSAHETNQDSTHAKVLSDISSPAPRSPRPDVGIEPLSFDTKTTTNNAASSPLLKAEFTVIPAVETNDPATMKERQKEHFDEKEEKNDSHVHLPRP